MIVRTHIHPFFPNVGMGAFLGATGLAPLTDPSGNHVFASGPGANGAQLYEDNTGTIVDINGNSSDPNTGEAYSYEIEGLYTAAQPSAPVGVLAPQVPTGSTLSYAASWNIGLVGVTPSTVVSELSARLAPYSLAVAASSASAPSLLSQSTVGTMQLAIHDSIGHNLLSDAQSILDSLLKQIVGSGNFIQSSIGIVSSPQSGNQPNPTGPPLPGQTVSLPGWLANLISPSSSTPSSGTSPLVWLAVVGLIIVAVKK